MKCKIFGLLVLWFALLPLAVQAQTTSGRIPFSGTAPALSGPQDLTFILYDAEIGGTAFYIDSQTVDVTTQPFPAVLGAGNGGDIDPGIFAVNPSVFIAIELTSTPGAEIAPRVPINSSGYARNAATLGNSVFTDASGNVGIGTNVPEQKLTVQTPAGSYGIIHTDGTRAVGTYVGGSSSGADGGWLGTKSNHALHLFTNNGQPSITIATNGNVGIGRSPGLGSNIRLWMNGGLSVSNSGPNYAGDFQGSGPEGRGVRINTNTGVTALAVYGGTKSAIVATTQGARALYTEESSEVWFTDYGFGRLQNKATRIEIDPLFAEAVNLDEPYHLFVQAYGNAELYVSQRTPKFFEVHWRAGEPDVEFSYRIVAKRRGYERTRLEQGPLANDNPVEKREQPQRSDSMTSLSR